MQHPDEGTIHSWLDGALPAEEAASLEAHVSTCQSCATAVAEARGFIAASSRILTALDDVPRGVVPAVPAVPQKKRDLRVFWRAAAALLVVAGGSLVVMREGRLDTSAVKPINDSVSRTALPSVRRENPEAAEGSGTSAAQQNTTAPSEPPTAVPRAGAVKARVADERDLSASTERRRVTGDVGGVATGVVSGARVAADAAAPTVVTAQAANAAAAESEAALKVVKVERTVGARRTIYEIAPSQVVTLTEPEPVLTGEVAPVGVETTRIMLRGSSGREARSRAAATPAAPPPPTMTDSRAEADSVLASRESAVAKTAPARAQTGASFVAATNTITWTEARTGKTLTLSGNFPIERLQEIKNRIERERAARATP